MTRAAAFGSLVFAVALVRSLGDGPGLVDESWFLQVVARVRQGDVLYRDVFFGATPLSVYVTAALTFVTGIEIAAVKIVTNACFGATAGLVVYLAGRLGMRSAGPLIVAGMLVWARPYGNPPYTPMAMMLFVATLAALARTLEDWPRRTEHLWAWLTIGVLAGMSFAAKQNIGLLAAIAVVIAIAVAGRPAPRATARAALVALTGFVGSAAVVLLPVALSRGWTTFWEYAFSAKAGYVALGGVSYVGALGRWLEGSAGGLTVGTAAHLLHGAPLVLPLGVLMLAILVRRRLDRSGWLLLLFSAVAVATAAPRWDRFHMGYAVPVHLAALSYLWGLSASAWGRAGIPGWLRAAALTVAVLAVGAAPLMAVASGSRRVSRMALTRGTMLPAGEDARLQDAASRLTASAEGKTFLLTFEAGFWYLASGLRNPTPYDFPAATSMGASGAAWLLTRLAGGDIATVCLDDHRAHPLALAEAASFVRRHFERGPDVGPCTIFRAPPPRGAAFES